MTETLHNFAAGLHERLLDGQLDAEGRRWLGQHRATCPDCDRAFARLERITRALEDLEPLEPSRGFADRVLAEVSPAPLPAWARWRLTSAWQRVAASVAVGVVTAACLGVLLVTVLLVGEPGNVTLLFRAPALAIEQGLLSVLGVIDPMRALLDLSALLAGVVRTVLVTPQGSAAGAAGVLLSGVALRQLAHVLATPVAPPRG